MAAVRVAVTAALTVSAFLLPGCSASTVAGDTRSPGPTAGGTAGTAGSVPLPPAEPADAAPMYTATISEINADIAARMTTSWRPGCPVPLAELRYVTVTHVDFDGQVQTGELVVHADVAEDVTEIFGALFAADFPIRQMRLVDEFGTDDRSMAADNTSAFNCRAIAGGTTWSEHAFGRAIDINPVENPYLRNGWVAPLDGRVYVGRPDLPGVIHDDDAVVRAFADAGWQWGGDWTGPVDYQHFSPSGR